MLFISDLHLNIHRPDITEKFLILIEFIKNNKNNIKKLYILGDLFEIWIGDDAMGPFEVDILNMFKNIKNYYNIEIYFLAGNHDFLVGDLFFKKFNLIKLTEFSIINFNNINILLSHGDLLCTLDKNYQRFRKFIHHKFIKKIFLSLPVKLRIFFANLARHNSKHKNKKYINIKKNNKNNNKIDILDVTPNEDIKLLTQYNCDILIHGHTHRLKHHQLINNKQRFVLGSWEERANALYLSSDNKNLNNNLKFEWLYF